MATLIASKQISGVVTASVINGEFLVSGSSILTGSMFVTGAISASEISASSFTGDGSNLSFGGTNIFGIYWTQIWKPESLEGNIN